MLKIPKKIHQIWLGKKNMPDQFLQYQHTWLLYNPEWTLYTWNEANITSLKYFIPSYFSSLSNFSEQSDYLRFCIVLEMGGVYVDTDFECLRPLDLLLDNLDFFICNEHRGKESPSITAAIFGSVPELYIAKAILEGMYENIFSNKKTLEKVGPAYLTRYFLYSSVRNNVDINIKIFSANYFYPIPPHEYYRNMPINKEQLLLSGTYGIHHYANSWDFFGRLRQRIIKNKIGRFIYKILRPAWRLLYRRNQHSPCNSYNLDNFFKTRK